MQHQVLVSSDFGNTPNNQAVLREPRAFLRRATARLHRRLDQTPALATLMATDCSLLAYRAAMLGLAWAYQAVELALLRGAAYQPPGMPEYAPRTPRLWLDLSALERPPARWARPSAALLAALPAIDSQASYLGIRYVVEGAQQGSRFIRRALSQSLGEQLSRIGSFWASEVPWQDHWPACLAQLMQLSDPTALVAATRAARHTFRHFIACVGQAHRDEGAST
jgi:heme oxygenase